MKQTLGKLERLKSRKLIEKLYSEGDSIKKFPLRIVFLQARHTSNYPAQAGFSVSKRNFKNAIDRNKLKRLLRESYRKNKYIIYDQIEEPYVFMISYLGKEVSDYLFIEEKMQHLLKLFISKVNIKKQ